jgi:hypothetical protein
MTTRLVNKFLFRLSKLFTYHVVCGHSAVLEGAITDLHPTIERFEEIAIGYLAYVLESGNR